METVFYPASLRGVVQAPPSKSECQRRMICAAMTPAATSLQPLDPADDIEAFQRCIQALGAKVIRQGDQAVITGSAAPLRPAPTLDCGESGAALRFFLPITLCMTKGGQFVLHGGLSRRPMAIYQDLFVPQGVRWHMSEGVDGAAVLKVQGHMQAGDFLLPGNVSSQFISGLMFALPLLQETSTLQVLPPVESAGYIHMTLEALANSGIVLEELGPYRWRIPGNQTYRAANFSLPGDYSHGAVLLCAGALGHDITVRGLRQDTQQGDRAILRYLTQLGAQVDETDHMIKVQGGSLHGAVMDIRDCPDLLPCLALTCQLAQGESRLVGCDRHRWKETDRLEGTRKMLNKLGGCVQIQGDEMIIKGVDSLKGGVMVDTQQDHRLVMAAAVAATVCQEPIQTADVSALNKSWPGFLSLYRQLGGQAQ